MGRQLGGGKLAGGLTITGVRVDQILDVPRLSECHVLGLRGDLNAQQI